jgi:hypothetical protein
MAYHHNHNHYNNYHHNLNYSLKKSEQFIQKHHDNINSDETISQIKISVFMLQCMVLTPHKWANCVLHYMYS